MCRDSATATSFPPIGAFKTDTYGVRPTILGNNRNRNYQVTKKKRKELLVFAFARQKNLFVSLHDFRIWVFDRDIVVQHCHIHKQQPFKEILPKR